MELKFDKESLKQILKLYYKETENINGEIRISCKKEPVGFYEIESAVVSIKLVGSKTILGNQIPMERNITEDDVKNALSYVLEQEALDVENIEYNSGLNRTCEGYGMYERTVVKPYFKGIDVTVKENVKVKKIGGMKNE